MRKIEKINALAREMCDRTVPCDEKDEMTSEHDWAYKKYKRRTNR